MLLGIQLIKVGAFLERFNVAIILCSLVSGISANDFLGVTSVGFEIQLLFMSGDQWTLSMMASGLP